MRSSGQFKATEALTFSSQTTLTGVTISNSGPQELVPSFTLNTVLNGYNINENASTADDELYLDKISGKIVDWDVNNQQLVVFNDKNPINDNYDAAVTGGSVYTRNSDPSAQQSDIFRVGDYVQYTGQTANTEDWWEVRKVNFQEGISFVPEDRSSNTSGIAKYLTKEISLDNPGTSIDVKLTANVRDIKNLKVLYKIRESSSEVNFEDIEWKYFNVDGSPDITLEASAENEISGLFEKQESYQEIPFSASDLSEFSSFAVKVVMQSDNPAYVPKVQDLRAVASF